MKRINRKLKKMCRHQNVVYVEYGGIEKRDQWGEADFSEPTFYLICKDCRRQVVFHSAPRVYPIDIADEGETVWLIG